MTSLPPPAVDSITWISRLIALDTVSDRSNLPLIEQIEDALRSLGLDPLRIPNEEGTKASLLVTLPAADGSTTGGIMLSGHTDVVPVLGQDWTSDPFDVRVSDGRLYGRGAADMKGFCGVVLAAVPHFLQRPLQQPLHLAFSYDEEIGCLGAHPLVETMLERGIRPDVCIVGEPTSMRVVSGHKGCDRFRVHVTGVAAHASLAPNGANAIEYAARAIAFIRSIADTHRRDGPADPNYLVPYATISVGTIGGGSAVNIVPDTCEFEFEIRALSPQDAAGISARVEQFLLHDLRTELRAENAGAEITMVKTVAVPALLGTAPTPASVLAESLTGTSTEDKVTYGTEAGIFQLAGIPSVVCGPGSIEQAHVADEYIELTQITACEEFLSRLALRMQTPVSPAPHPRSRTAMASPDGAAAQMIRSAKVEQAP